MRTYNVITAISMGALVSSCALFYVKPIAYDAYLKGDYETPAVKTEMVGDFVLSSKGSFTLNVTHIDGAMHKPTVAHLHCGKEGVPGPAVYTLVSDPGVVGNVYSYSSSINDRKFTPNPKTESCPIVIDSIDKLEEAISKGYIYVNVHTKAHPGGEIRGQLAKE